MFEKSTVFSKQKNGNLRIKRFRPKEPEIEGIQYTGDNIAELVEFVGDAWRERDWIANGMVEEEGAYQPLIQSEGGDCMFYFDQEEFEVIKVGDYILRDGSNGNMRVWLCTKEDNEEYWTQAQLYEKYEEY